MLSLNDDIENHQYQILKTTTITTTEEETKENYQREPYIKENLLTLLKIVFLVIFAVAIIVVPTLMIKDNHPFSNPLDLSSSSLFE